MHTLQLTAFGVGVDVECRGPHAAPMHETLSELWAACLRNGGPAESTVDATADHPESVAAVIAAVSSRVTLAAIDARAGQLLMLHAAGIEAAPGRVVALVAPSGVGKTTAARTLGATFPYVTDETVAITDDGDVIAYPKPLSIGAPETAKAQVSPAAAELAIASAPLRLAGVVVLNRQDDGPQRPAVEELETLDACAIIAEQTSYLGAVPHGLDRLVNTIESVGPAWRVTYREASTLAPVISTLVAEPARLAAERVIDVARGHDAQRAPGNETRAPWGQGWEGVPATRDHGGKLGEGVRVVHRETGALVLSGTRVLRLSPLAACVVAGLSAGADAGAIAARAAAIFGEPPGASALDRVTATIAELREVPGLLG